jgi:AmmeMemoRadiSam system protein A
MSSADGHAGSRLDESERSTLLAVARDSIAFGFAHSRALDIEAADFPAELRPLRATFVTLRKGGQLRGCIGGLEAHRPLVVDIAVSAFAAAFRDTRFSPVGEKELDELSLHISILAPLEKIAVADQQELERTLRPGVDGLLLRAGSKRGTFLPSVWDNVSGPRQFIENLKQKAGLAVGMWSSRWEVFRYTVESFPDEHGDSS